MPWFLSLLCTVGSLGAPWLLPPCWAAREHLLPALFNPRGCGRTGGSRGWCWRSSSEQAPLAFDHYLICHCPQTQGHLQPAGAARAGSYLVKEGTSPCCLNIVNCVLNGGHSLRNLNSSSLCPRLPPAKVLSIIRSKTYLHSCRARGQHTPVRVWVFMYGVQAFIFLCF